MEKTGLAIVGGSAGGLAAALVAARAGVDVTLLEAKQDIAVPPPPAITALDFLWPKEFEQPPHALVRRLAGSRLRASDGRGPYIDSPLSLIDRTKYDQWLADLARKAGARILTGVQGLEAQPDRTLTAPGLALKPDVILFADGARSQANRFMRPMKDPNAMQWGASLEFTAPEPPSDGRLYVTLGAHLPGGRSQLNPLGNDRWSHWTFYRGDPGQGEEMARMALDLDARLMGWDKPDARFSGVGPDPLYTIPDQLVAGNVMVAGGAAGQGGLEAGLHAGLLAGEVVAKTLKGKGELAEYERRWKKRWLRSYERLRRSNDGTALLTDEEIRTVAGAWDGRHVGAKPTLGQVVTNPKGVLALLKAARLAKGRA